MATGSKRNVKQTDGVYLMEHVNCPAVLVECGFLSNHAEEAKLRNYDYQKIIAMVIASGISIFL
jgi:N-acetylmuramoyl-L-alanine amidase